MHGQAPRPRDAFAGFVDDQDLSRSVVTPIDRSWIGEIRRITLDTHRVLIALVSANCFGV